MNFLNNINFSNIKNIPFKGIISAKNENNAKNQENQFNFFKNPQKDSFEPSFKRLNDTDSNIINNNLHKFVPADSLRIELDLEKTEDKLSDVKSDIKVLKFLGYDDNNSKIAELQKKEKELSEKIRNDRDNYRNLGIMNKITDSAAVFYLDTIQKAKETSLSFHASPIVQKLKSALPALNSRTEAKETLNNSIMFGNKFSSVLSKTIVPYGEEGERFAKLAEMMANKNKIELKINDILKQAKKPQSIIKRTYESVKSIISANLSDFDAKIKSFIPIKRSKENIFAVKFDKHTK